MTPPKGGSKSVSITLQEKDRYILEQFKEELKLSHSLASDGRGCLTIAARSNKMADDLKKYGIVPRKSFKTFLPSGIDERLMPHMVRGILDGDGCIQMKQKAHHYVHRVSFCGSHRLMEELSTFLYEKLHLNFKPRVYDYKTRVLSEFALKNINDIKVFLSWIYDDAKFFLKRKKEAYDNFLDHYNFKQGNTEVSSEIAQGSETP